MTTSLACNAAAAARYALCDGSILVAPSLITTTLFARQLVILSLTYVHISSCPCLLLCVCLASGCVGPQDGVLGVPVHLLWLPICTVKGW